MQRYNEKHNAILLYDEDKCVGYIVTVPIKKELYKSFINGVLINDLNINPKMYVNKSKYNYIVSCVILDEYRKKGYGSSLMEKMFSNTSGRYCTLSITKEGFFLANKYMKLKEKINNDVSVFVK